MATRALERPPRILGLYARAAAPLLPGASRLPWIGGGGGEVPDLELTLAQVRVGRERVAEYASVCAFARRDTLPATYVHVLAFPLQLALMADGRFPFAALGLVHVANRIVQHRPIGLDEPLELRVRATPSRAHSRGREFSLRSDARVAGELVWEELATMLRRGPGGAARAGEGARARDQWTSAREDDPPAPAATWTLTSAQWRLPGDLGRRYAAVSGDGNPIHLHALSARPFGFPRAIAHGMWTKARCLAALAGPDGGALPAAFAVEARFRRPILLPASVDFASAADGPGVSFQVRGGGGGPSHLDGRIRAIEQSR
ncbi:MAG TPA: MaoC/PaaZ C-terminal domain-containing protein [Solirubrobacteraceae bacterium]|nr:MaoC/PaaZ C-terminal domain-containing protein [Solirubrobacteraceae bacterium]